MNNSRIGKKLNEVVRFYNIKKGDYIVYPVSNAIIVATATDKRKYSKEAIKYDLANQLSVEFKKSYDKICYIERKQLSEGFQRRLRVIGNTVSDLNEFKNELNQIFEKEYYSLSAEIAQIHDNYLSSLKFKLLNKIPSGKTHLEGGGVGLELLVQELMEIEGYDAIRLNKKTFEGDADADVKAIKTDPFTGEQEKILVQVKHHEGISKDDGIKQLIKAKEIKEYEDHIGYFVTSAQVSTDSEALAEANDITIIDGEKLADLIIKNINKLKPETLNQLGICMEPILLDDLKKN